MRKLLNLIFRYHFFLVFLIFEGLSLSLVFRFNQPHQTIYLSSANSISAFFLKEFNAVSQYFSLHVENQELVQENSYLKNKIVSNQMNTRLVNDTLKKFSYLPARVINNSTNRNHNYLTLNVGKRDGLDGKMGVINSEGLVGLVYSTSDNYSAALSLLNKKLLISAKIKRTGYFGSLNWNGEKSNASQLHEIPSHVDVIVGDTVVTSGYSHFFPEDLMIGIVKEVKKSDENFLKIQVSLAADFSSIQNVYVIFNNHFEEIQKIEEQND